MPLLPAYSFFANSNLFLYIKKDTQKNGCLFWRRRRDSNSRVGFPAYALSRGASSPA